MRTDKRNACCRPHKAAAAHVTPAWKAARWTRDKFLTRVLDERRRIDFWPR